MTQGKVADCPSCGANRWKTLAKGKKWQCHKCGHAVELGKPWFPEPAPIAEAKYSDVKQGPTYIRKKSWWERLWR